MSKHSMRSGSASSPSASCSPSSASTRCWRRRSALSFSPSSASRALRSASSRIRALVAALGRADLDARAAPRAERRRQLVAVLDPGLDDDLRRDRHLVGVVLVDELRGHHALRRLGDVLEVERLAVGEHPVADLEDLGVGVGAVDGHRDGVERPDRLVGDPLALHDRLHRAQPVARQRGVLVVLLLGGQPHLALELALDLAVAPRQEGDDPVDRLGVLGLVDQADAGRPAALDVVVEARRAAAAPRLGAVARPEQEDLAERSRSSPACAWRSSRGRSTRGWSGASRA